jgi:hypothetical protein
MNIGQITSASNVTFTCSDTVVGGVEFLSKEYFDEWRKTFKKQHAELVLILQPKPYLLRYLRVKLKKIKRIFK